MLDRLDAIELCEACLGDIFQRLPGGIGQEVEVKPDHRRKSLCISMGIELADSRPALQADDSIPALPNSFQLFSTAGQ